MYFKHKLTHVRLEPAPVNEDYRFTFEKWLLTIFSLLLVLGLAGAQIGCDELTSESSSESSESTSDSDETGDDSAGDSSDDGDDNDDSSDNDPPPAAVTEELWLYAQDLAPTFTDMNLGGRAGIDAFCTANIPANFDCDTAHGFVSVDADDEIRDMPGNYGFPADVPIKSKLYGTDTEATLLTSFNAIAAGGETFAADFFLYQVETDRAAGLAYFLSGADEFGADDGSVDTSLTCSAWTSNSNTQNLSGIDTFNGSLLAEWAGTCDRTQTWGAGTGQETVLACICY